MIIIKKYLGCAAMDMGNGSIKMVYFELFCIELIIFIVAVTICDAMEVEANPMAIILVAFAAAGIFLIEKGAL